eukprot:TRINITY_DN1130_c0_g1_i1.p1 TRINITY_DN1130_c0_g1~~TRINITY_DN1130_c0_g1_i1.p1  ORF type:complete len:502 (+),score=140.16 TRINITY_DN1130_c0_g1_i1:33-1508(+)
MVTPHDDATHTQKVRHVFDVMTRDGSVINFDEWRTAFQRLRIDLGSDTIKELFDNAAVSNKVTMRFAEFQMFSEQYPTILDCLYYRSKDDSEDKRQQQEIDDLRNQIQKARDKEVEACDAHRDASLQLEDCKRNMGSLELQYQDAIDKANSCKMYLEEARAHTAQERQKMRQDQAALKNQRDQERLAQNKIEQSQRETQMALNALRGAEADLRELQRELERRMAEVETMKDKVRECYDNEDMLLKDASAITQGVQEKEQMLGQSEDILHRCTVAEQNGVTDYRDACDQVNKLKEQLDRASHDMKSLNDKVTSAATQIDSNSEACKDLERKCGALERNNANFSAMRLQTAEEESELLHEEVTLRRQRMVLESREAKLRNRSFSKSRRIGSSSPDARGSDARTPLTGSPMMERSPVTDRSPGGSYSPYERRGDRGDRGDREQAKPLRSYHISPPRPRDSRESQGTPGGDRFGDRERYNTVHYTPSPSQGTRQW